MNNRYRLAYILVVSSLLAIGLVIVQVPAHTAFMAYVYVYVVMFVFSLCQNYAEPKTKKAPPVEMYKDTLGIVWLTVRDQFGDFSAMRVDQLLGMEFESQATTVSADEAIYTFRVHTSPDNFVEFTLNESFEDFVEKTFGTEFSVTIVDTLAHAYEEARRGQHKPL